MNDDDELQSVLRQPASEAQLNAARELAAKIIERAEAVQLESNDECVAFWIYIRDVANAYVPIRTWPTRTQ